MKSCERKHKYWFEYIGYYYNIRYWFDQQRFVCPSVRIMVSASSPDCAHARKTLSDLAARRRSSIASRHPQCPKTQNSRLSVWLQWLHVWVVIAFQTELPSPIWNASAVLGGHLVWSWPQCRTVNVSFGITCRFWFFTLAITAICTEPCLNGGNCISHDVCQCLATHRGPQCQYDVESCSPKRMQFNGAYNCTGDNTKLRCSISCPAGVGFEFQPAREYVCTYATGKYMPETVPQCQFSKYLYIEMYL